MSTCSFAKKPKLGGKRSYVMDWLPGGLGYCIANVDNRVFENVQNIIDWIMNAMEN